MGQDGENTLLGDAPAGQQAVTSIQEFEIQKMLGKGSFAEVILAKRISNQRMYAIKVIKKSLVVQANESQHTNDELRILMTIQHPFIIKLHGAFQNADNLYLVLDFMQGGELFHHIQKQRCFPEKTAMFFAAMILCGLQELHDHQIIMRDLKPENILMDNKGYLKITDFGLSKVSSGGSNVVGTTFCGTAEYLSPEQLRNQPHGIEVDYWALGCILYELIAGAPPFYNRDHKQMFKAILKGEPRFTDRFSPACQQLIKQLLEKDPKKRPSVADIKKSPFFKPLNWEKLMQRQYELDYKPTEHLNKDNVACFDERFTQQTIDLNEIYNIDKQVAEGDLQSFPGFMLDDKIGGQPAGLQQKEIPNINVESPEPPKPVEKKPFKGGKKPKLAEDDE